LLEKKFPYRVNQVDTTWFKDSPFKNMTTEVLKQFIDDLDNEKDAD